MIITDALRLSKLLGAVLMFSVGASGQADFSASPTTGTVPLSVQFTDLTPGALIGWTWDFGDGSFGGGPTSMHTYDTPGTYSVTLSVFAGFPPALESVTKTDLIAVDPEELVPDFSAVPSSGEIPLTVGFTDQTTGVAPDSFAWDFGDGKHSSEQNPIHDYKDVGAFDVTLEVTYLGQIERVTKLRAVIVEPVVMVPAFSMTPVVGGAPLEVSFLNQSTGQEPTSWSWKWNNSDIGSSQDLTHVFETTGTYDITLTMTYFGQQESLTIPDAIRVLPTLSFVPPTVLDVGPDPLRLALGDVSGDGSLDILVSSSSESRLRTLLNDGSGGFSAPVFTPLSSPISNWVLGDMNSDGREDIVTFLDATPTDLNVLLSDGGGAFTTSIVFTVSDSEIQWVSILDADEDGANDIAIACPPIARVVFGDGLGGVSPETSDVPASGNESWSLVLPIDANTDDHVDLLLAGNIPIIGFGFEWDVVLGDGTGEFTAQSESMTAIGGYGFESVTTGDVTGDGYVDALASDNEYLRLARGTGSGLTTDPIDQLLLFISYVNLATGDLDSDGDAELMASSTQFGGEQVDGVSLLIGADPFPGSWQHFELHSKTGEVAVGDLDGDGVDDVVTLHPLDGTLSLLFNRTVPTGWTDVGHALAGTIGEPVLTGSGTLQPGSDVSLTLTNALPNAPSAVFVGLHPIEQSFLGGVLVPAPDAVLVGASTDANGEMLLRDRWPLNAGSGISVWYQVWVLDPGGSHGASASNAVASKS
jgi:PKD repeat protein